jgi:uncharacterized protein (UPF0333 family)
MEQTPQNATPVNTSPAAPVQPLKSKSNAPLLLGLLLLILVIGVSMIYIGSSMQNENVMNKNDISPTVSSSNNLQSPTSTADWKTVENTKYNFSVKVPLEMQLKPGDETNNTMFFAVASKTASIPTNGKNFYIGYETAKKDINSPEEQLTCKSNEDAYQRVNKSMINLPNFKLINSIILGESTKGTMSAKDNRYWLKYSICREGKVFTFDFQPYGYPESYINNEYKTDFVDPILASFKFN